MSACSADSGSAGEPIKVIIDSVIACWPADPWGSFIETAGEPHFRLFANLRDQGEALPRIGVASRHFVAVEPELRGLLEHIDRSSLPCIIASRSLAKSPFHLTQTRAPASPPRAKATSRKTSCKRAVTRACGATSSGSRSTKMRWQHAELRQKNLRTASWSRTVTPAQGKSAGVRT